MGRAIPMDSISITAASMATTQITYAGNTYDNKPTNVNYITTNYDGKQYVPSLLFVEFGTTIQLGQQRKGMKDKA